VTWIAPDLERSEDYPERRNEPEQQMLRDWLDWHRATLLRECAGLDAAQLATRAVPPRLPGLVVYDLGTGVVGRRGEPAELLQVFFPPAHSPAGTGHRLLERIQRPPPPGGWCR